MKNESTGIVGKLKNHRLVKSMQGDGLRAKAMRGSGWTIAGFGTSQVLRLGSNLILTRLLFPEAFGLMVLAQMFLQGLNMLSDIGIGPSIIQNKRGGDPNFLATAWTMQVIRGFALFLGMCLLAYPASRIYDERLLFPILILIGSTAVVTGFQSIGMATASRKMALGRLTMIDLISQIVGISTMVTWAWLSPTVWALVGGGVSASIIRVVLGHRILRSAGNRFHLERSAVHEIFHFGKWIFITSILTFLTNQGDRILLGAYISMEELGVYAVALAGVSIISGVVGRAIQQVGFPLFSEIVRERPKEIAFNYYRIRRLIEPICYIASFLLLWCGPRIVGILYDDRYAKAGIIVQILSASVAFGPIAGLNIRLLWAMGRTRIDTLIQSIRSVCLFISIPIGYALGGLEMAILAITISNVLGYPSSTFVLYRSGLISLRKELVSGVIFIIYAVIGVSYFAY